MWPESLHNAGQFLRAFCPNPYQSGQKARENWREMPSDPLLAVQAFRGAAWAWPGFPSGRGPNFARKHSKSQVHRWSNPPSTQLPGVPVSRPAVQPALPLGLNPNPRLGFHASVPRGLGPKPSQLGMTETNSRTLPAIQGNTVPFGAAQNPQSGRNLHCPLKP